MNDISLLPTHVNGDLPTITNITPSARTVHILKNLCYDRFSEMTALTTYLYQDWSWFPFRADFADAMEKIAIVEMTHLDALSNAIVSFGGKPDFSMDGKFWNAKSVNFNISLQSALNENIRAEEGAIEEYQKAIANVENESLKRLFERIIEDEKLHIVIFKQMLNSL